jgi:hypothetical protein
MGRSSEDTINVSHSHLTIKVFSFVLLLGLGWRKKIRGKKGKKEVRHNNSKAINPESRKVYSRVSKTTV